MGIKNYHYKAVLFIILLLVLTTTSLAMECHIDFDPFVRLTSNPTGLCIPTSASNGQCVTWLSNPDNNTEIWGLMPERKYVDGVGEVDYYDGRFLSAGIVVEFSKERLYDNTTVTFNARCGTETVAYNVTPHFADYEEIAEGFLWGKQNMNYLITAIFLMFAFIAFIIYIAWRQKNA